MTESEHCRIWGCDHKGVMCSLCKHYIGGLVVDIDVPDWYGKTLGEIRECEETEAKEFAPQDW